MAKVYISIGSNIGDRKVNLESARKFIVTKAGSILKVSLIYETEAWGFKEQPSFYNQVILVNTLLTPHELMIRLKEIENKMGRIHLGKWKQRLIDLDILYFDDLIVSEELLKIPHPFIQDRKFNLIPLCEISPEVIHPVLKRSNIELLSICKDQLEVKKVQ